MFACGVLEVVLGLSISDIGAIGRLL